MADYSQDLDRLARELAEHLPVEARRPALHEAIAETDAKAPGGFLSISDTASLIARAAAETDTLRAIMIEEKNKGNSALAEALAHYVSERDKQEPDVDRSRTLISRAIEAQAVLAQGRANEAEKTLRALIPEMERQFGPESPNTLTTRHELAHALLDQGKATEAEAAFRDLLPLMERVHGPEHRNTLSTRHELVRALLDQGKATEAEAAFRDLLSLRERVQGPEHKNTLATRRGLVRATLEQGAAEQAREALSALPDSGDQPPAAKARNAMLRGWLADLDGERPAADTLLDQAGALLSYLEPAHYMRRELARYRETRGPDGKGGTMVAAEYARPS